MTTSYTAETRPVWFIFFREKKKTSGALFSRKNFEVLVSMDLNCFHKTQGKKIAFYCVFFHVYIKRHGIHCFPPLFVASKQTSCVHVNWHLQKAIQHKHKVIYHCQVGLIWWVLVTLSYCEVVTTAWGCSGPRKAFSPGSTCFFLMQNYIQLSITGSLCCFFFERAAHYCIIALLLLGPTKKESSLSKMGFYIIKLKYSLMGCCLSIYLRGVQTTDCGPTAARRLILCGPWRVSL